MAIITIHRGLNGKWFGNVALGPDESDETFELACQRLEARIAARMPATPERATKGKPEALDGKPRTLTPACRAMLDWIIAHPDVSIGPKPTPAQIRTLNWLFAHEFVGPRHIQRTDPDGTTYPVSLPGYTVLKTE